MYLYFIFIGKNERTEIDDLPLNWEKDFIIHAISISFPLFPLYLFLDFGIACRFADHIVHVLH